MLDRIADDVWVVQRPLRFLALETGTRMTVLRLRRGGLFVHSPVALDDALKEAVDALGEVAAIVAPNRFHHLYAGDWARAYPNALVAGAPGLDVKRKDVAWSRILGDEAEAEWRGELDQVHFGACTMLSEVVFFHRASRSIVSSDFVFNLATHPSAFTRFAGRMLGQVAPGPTLLERVMIRDHRAAREQVDRIAAWDAQRIVLAHGDIIEEGGSATVNSAYSWLRQP